MKPVVTAFLLFLTILTIITTDAQLIRNGALNARTRQTAAAVSQCGPVHGSCPSGLCCSAYNDCGNTIAHCNVSLGCKNKWGNCS
ncbi:Uncharacterized protein APZ42_022020 [Daphnia magna]|uniref:Uncharacterized protein n=2 Tax=Daphnia magna TaxID=35525 RepID=A0ABR0B2U9_9CRUS|nr:hypothetical protein OUZ56_028085 [Daphnia magna]KZS12796.1 Uncharacterized protein APZ42_022020 [Daphnia magna]